MRKQTEFKRVKGWGGRRIGAGRKNKSGRVNHQARETVKISQPVHITMRLKGSLKGLRSPRLLREFRGSLGKARVKGLRTLHYSLQSNHLHLVAEGENNAAIATGMNSFGARFGRIVRRKIGGKGSVFDGRYHLKIIRTPRQMRNTLAYVLLNQSKHLRWEPDYDDYSSARYFRNWRLLLGTRAARSYAEGRGEALPDHLDEAKSWLARAGWRKAV